MEELDSPTIFEWLKRRRKALDLTQDELAQRVGCSVGAIRKIESGDRRPSKQLAALLASALEIPDDERQTFIRVVRGELNLERLGPTGGATHAPVPTVADLLQSQPRTSPDAFLKPPSPSQRIPLQATPLIGRENELAAMERLFGDPQCRLLTLTGIGGIGKTRLAIEFATRKSTMFSGGVFYIPLAPIYASEKIIPAAADVLGFVFSGPNDPKEQLFSYISSHIKGDALFVLDNLEQLLAQLPSPFDRSGVVELVSEMLQRLPNLKILGTSRERLNIHGEWAYELYGLSVPPIDYFGNLEEYDAVTLFVRSAQRVKPDFQVLQDEQQPVIRICQMVQGVPLAIELAAAWVGMLSCPEIAQEIKSNMDFLTSSMRDIPERHRSIRATFDHSWKLLSEDERWALCRLSVFQGGFDRNAAGQVAGASLPLLASLSAKSLVRRAQNGRYDLHEVIRQYALSHLKDQPRSFEIYERHCSYYLNWLQERASLLKTGAQQETIQQMTGEIDNIRAAWVWGIEHKRFNQLEQAGRGFGWYYEITGLYREGIEQFELLVQALKSEQEEKRHRTLGLTLIHQALLNFRKGEFERARMLYEESILNLRPAGDQALLGDALVFLGTIQHLIGEYKRAASTLEEGLFYARQSKEPWFEAWAVYNLGHVESLLGRYEQGYEQMLTGLAMWRELGDPQSIALGLNFLIQTMINLGRFDDAKNFMHESIALCEQSKNRWGLGTAYRYLGLVYLAEGQLAPAKTNLLKSLKIFGEFSVGWDIARSLAYLGDVAMLAGEYNEARKTYQDALVSALEANATPIALDALLGLGELDAGSGKAEKAIVLCFYILDHPASENETRNRAEKLRVDLESRLSSEVVSTARELANDVIMELILGEAKDVSYPAGSTPASVEADAQNR